MAKQTKKLSREEKERRKNMKRQRAISLVLVFIMVGGLVGIGAYNMSGGNSAEQIGPYDASVSQYTDFYRPDYKTNALFLETDSGQIPFYTQPSDYDRFTTNETGNFTELLYDKHSIIISGYSEKASEGRLLDMLRYDVSNNAPVPIIKATPEPVDELSQAVIDCMNATSSQPVVVIEFSNETTFTRDGSCLKITSKPEHTHIVRDRLLYNLIGVDA